MLPTEILSTPVAATDLTVLKLIFPEVSNKITLDDVVPWSIETKNFIILK